MDTRYTHDETTLVANLADNFRCYTKSICRNKTSYTAEIENKLTTTYNKLEEQLQEIPDFRPDLYRMMSDITSDIAIYHFNNDQIMLAAMFYLKTIHWLEKVECNTKELRNSIKYALDLSECYMLLAQADLALKACHFAIKIFEYLPESKKTPAEKNIKNPREQILDFYLHYQKLSSTPMHFHSAAFNNIKQLFIQVFETDNIGNLLSDLNLSFEQNNCTQLTDLLAAMKTDSQQPQLDMIDDLSPNDGQTRHQINELNTLLTAHKQANNKESINDTINQLLRCYDLLNNKSEEELATIILLKQQKKTISPASMFYHSSASSRPSSYQMDCSP